MDTSVLAGGLSGMVAKSMTTSLAKLTGEVGKAIKKLLDMLKPALEQVGKFIIKFGAKVQDVIESFSVTLDRVQKTFDQIMASTAPKGANAEAMLHETFHLFDTTNTGTIEVVDLQNVAKIYNIPALQGNKSDDLVKKYDQDQSGDLNKHEFTLMLDDKNVPNLMSVVLRSFAKSLAQVAGKVGGSKFREEIAMDVADYLELMVAKNHTKVEWISDALGNESLPLDFVADVIAAMALKVDDPNTHKSIPTGSFVLSQLMKLHPKTTAKAIDKVSNATYWTSQGFSPEDHATVVKRVTKWSTQKHSSESLTQVESESWTDDSTLTQQQISDVATVSADGSVDVSAPTMLLERKLIDVMEDLAFSVAEDNMRSHLDMIKAEHHRHTADILGSDTAQYLLLHLMGGQRASKRKSNPNDPAAMATKAQIPAAPETLKFAKYLSWNATATSTRFQKMSFDYQKTSSNAIDSFATQIQGMVKKIQGFIKMMMQYSTPDGINSLETTLASYADKALADMLIVTKIAMQKQQVDKEATERPSGKNHSNRFMAALDSSLGRGLAPSLTRELRNAAKDDASKGSQLSKEVTNLFEEVAETALLSVSQSLDDVMTMQASFLHIDVGNCLKPLHTTGLGSFDRSVLSDIGKDVDTALRHARVAPKTSLLKIDDQMKDETQVSGITEDAVQLLHSLTSVLPQASKALIFAKKEVSMLSKTLDNIFKTFKKEGPDVLDEVMDAYGEIWTMYYFVMLFLPLALLFYAFWAGGFFGGPGAKVRDQDEPPKPKSALESCTSCFENCCRSMCCCHDNPWAGEMCFWSVCIFLQFVVLLLFVLAIVITLTAAVQLFLAAGCSQIYILGDKGVCGTVLSSLRVFLETFIPDVVKADFPQHCVSEELLMCDIIGPKLSSAAMYTVLGAFASAAMTFQLLIESATLHQRAMCRMSIEREFLGPAKDAGDDTAKPELSAKGE
jgi:hypothetical protein